MGADGPFVRQEEQISVTEMSAVAKGIPRKAQEASEQIYTIREKLGSGSYGTVYKALKKGKINYKSKHFLSTWTQTMSSSDFMLLFLTFNKPEC